LYQDAAMLFRPSNEDLLNEIGERLHRASAANSDLFAVVLAKACPRLAFCKPTMLKHLHRLLETGAYVDAALAVLEFELPLWRVHRLTFDAGEWHCLLSRTPWMPIEFDDTAQAQHECLPLAILSSFIEARRAHLINNSSGCRTVPQVQPGGDMTLCCENFS
jgi:hypothetical protein